MEYNRISREDLMREILLATQESRNAKDNFLIYSDAPDNYREMILNPNVSEDIKKINLENLRSHYTKLIEYFGSNTKVHQLLELYQKYFPDSNSPKRLEDKIKESNNNKIKIKKQIANLLSSSMILIEDLTHKLSKII